MLSLAYFSPFRPNPSGISDYTHDLLPYLAEVAHVTAVTPDLSLVDSAELDPIPLIDFERFSAESHRFDLPLYHIGNSAHHNDIYAMLRQRPGIVVLHDNSLREFMAVNQYWRERAYQNDEANITTVPFNKRVLDLALGVIVHNRFSAEKIAQTHPHLPVQFIPHLMDVVSVAKPPPDSDSITFGATGQITRNKCLDAALAAFAKFYARHQTGRFIIMGQPLDVNVDALTAALPAVVRTRVEHFPYITDFAQYQQTLAAIDVVVALRNPTLGETSGGALRSLAQGKPLIVYDHGWYAELPNTVALKVPVGDQGKLVEAFEQMAVDVEAFSAETIPYIQQNHAPRDVAQQFVTFAEQIISRISAKFAP